VKFTYQARNKEGKSETGIIEASSKEEAASLLQKYNVVVVSLKEVKGPFSLFKGWNLFRKISKKDLAIFSRQLAVMLDSRVPVVQSLLSLSVQTSKTSFKDVIVRISQLVEEGNTLSEAFSNFPKVFSTLYISLIKSGEASGKISETFYYLSDHLEREYDINSKMKEAMIYPSLVLVVMAVVVVIVMTVVMPKLVGMINELGAKVPLPTRILLSFYKFFNVYGWLIIIAFIGLIIFLVYYLRTKEGKKVYDKASLKIPLLGKFFEKIFLSRFAENLSTLISAGLPITQALKITKNTIGNYVYRRIVAETEKQVSEGEKISSVLVKYPERVPSFIIQMVKVGEETGKLDKTLMEIVNFYKKEIDKTVSMFTTLIEPILIIILGFGVALIAVAVISPLYGVLGSI